MIKAFLLFFLGIYFADSQTLIEKPIKKRILPKITINKEKYNFTITGKYIYTALCEINNTLCLFWYGECINAEDFAEDEKIYDKYNNFVGIKLYLQYDIICSAESTIVYSTGVKTYKQEILNFEELIFCKPIELEKYTIFAYLDNRYVKEGRIIENAKYLVTKQGLVIEHLDNIKKELYTYNKIFYKKDSIISIPILDNAINLVPNDEIINAQLVINGYPPKIAITNHAILWKNIWEIDQAIKHKIYTIDSLTKNLLQIGDIYCLIEFYPPEYKKYIYMRICYAAYQVQDHFYLETALRELLTAEIKASKDELHYWDTMMHTAFLDPCFLTNLQDISLYMSDPNKLSVLQKTYLAQIKFIPPVCLSDNLEIAAEFNSPKNWQNIDQILLFVDKLIKEKEYLLAHIMIKKYLFQNQTISLKKKISHIIVFFLTYNIHEIYLYLYRTNTLKYYKKIFFYLIICIRIHCGQFSTVGRAPDL